MFSIRRLIPCRRSTATRRSRVYEGCGANLKPIPYDVQRSSPSSHLVQRDDPHWFGGRIPDSPTSAERHCGTREHIVLYGTLKSPNGGDASAIHFDRTSEIVPVGQQPASFPCETERHQFCQVLAERRQLISMSITDRADGISYDPETGSEAFGRRNSASLQQSTATQISTADARAIHPSIQKG